MIVSRDELHSLLEHLLTAAGAPHLMTDDLKKTIVEHCAANPRILMQQCAELLDHAMRKDLNILDEKLFIDTFGALKRPNKPRRKPR